MLKMILIPLTVLAVGVANADTPTTYINTKYGFSIEIPSNITECLSPPPNPNHGVILLLNPSATCVGHPASSSVVYVNGEFDAYMTKNLKQLSDNECLHGGRLKVSADSFQIPGIETDSCMIENTGGALQVRVVAQRPDGSHYINSFIDYEVVLTTTQAKVYSDLRVFRALLHGIRFFPLEK